MKQKIIATIIGMALVISPLPALTADSSVVPASGPLAPGKAAGIQAAQGEAPEGFDWVWVATFGAALGVGVWVLTKKSDNGGGGGTTPTPTPSATTTTTTTP